MINARKVYDNRDKRREALRPFFKSILGVSPHLHIITGTELDDTIIEESDAASILWEYKNELG